MIAGVAIRALKQIPDERGKIMHMLRRDDAWFKEFGEIYFSVVDPGKIKAWHLHKSMTLNYAVPHGTIHLVLFDDREGSKTRGEVQEISLGGKDYALVTIPPGVWNGFTGTAEYSSIVANCASEPHDPAEIVRLDPHSEKIPYDWAKGTRG